MEIEVERVGHGGDGVGRLPSGKVVFVPGALPGERIRLRGLEEKKRYARAELDAVLEASPRRRAEDCPLEAAGCGGCGWRHVADDASLPLKAAAAYREVQKIARGYAAWPELECVPAPALDGARRRARLQVSSEGLGFYRRGTREVLVTVPGCVALEPAVMRAAEALSEVLRGTPGEAPRSVLIERVGDVVVASWGGAVQGAREAALSALVSEGALASVRVGWGRQTRTLGAAWVEELAEVGGHALRYQRQAGTFGQASEVMNAALREAVFQAVSAAGEAPRVLDLYAGSGNLSLAAAAAGASRVLGLESSRAAIEALSRSASSSGLSERVSGEVCDLRRGLPKRLSGEGFDVVVLDPPRSGAREVMKGVRGLDAERVLYVACEPTVMARDLKALRGAYRVTRARAFDMFPRTPHLEMMLELRRERRG